MLLASFAIALSRDSIECLFARALRGEVSLPDVSNQPVNMLSLSKYQQVLSVSVYPSSKLSSM